MSTQITNPLLAPSPAPFAAPQFHLIGRSHFAPAIAQALEWARAEIEAIAHDPKAPTFGNTIATLDFAGQRLDRIASMLFNLNHAETDPELQAIAQQVAPQLTDFSNDIKLNPTLFGRVSHVYRQRASLGLSAEESTLLGKTYRGFVRSGAALPEGDKVRYRAITRELSALTLRFEQHVLADTNAFYLHLTDSQQLDGLPHSLVQMAQGAARDRGLEGWVITLQAPMYTPFMKHSRQRPLRERLYRAYASRGCGGGDTDNRALALRIAELRRQKAQLLGYPSHAHYVLEERMAQSVEGVQRLLDRLLFASMPHALAEVEDVRAAARAAGEGGPLQRWDWPFYSELLKQQRFSINDEALRPYFALSRARDAVFGLAQRLFGISFRPAPEVPLYHPEVEAYEACEANGAHLAILYLDFFPRPGKSPGAWMTSYRPQGVFNGVHVRPLISIVCNFSRPVENTPSLLTFSEFTTLLHEFGHALHGMLANTTYPSLSGTSVYRDFVELPSQLLENWALEREFLDSFARHYLTHQPIPEQQIRAIIESRNFQAGFQTVRQLMLGTLDMAWHTITAPIGCEVEVFERQAIDSLELLPPVEGTAISPSFSHIFAGGYAAGYYSYKWAEVLDADAFALFQERGIFHRPLAQRLRKHILSAGGSEHPMTLYKRFRGREPDVNALLRRSGLAAKG